MDRRVKVWIFGPDGERVHVDLDDLEAASELVRQVNRIDGLSSYLVVK